MSQWQLTRNHRPNDDEQIVRLVRDEWVRPERGTLEAEALGDANKVYGGGVGEPVWEEMHVSPVTLVWIIDYGLWYSLTELAEELEG